MTNVNLILAVSLAVLVASSCCRTKVDPAIPVDKEMERKIENILKGMTLEEKIGQMCQLTIDTIDDKTKEDFAVDEEKMDLVFGKYKVGSILNVPRDVAQSQETWQALIRRIQEKSLEEIGIPCVYGLDQIHGTTYTLGGTLFPQGVNMAATFNRALVRKGSEISAYETKACSVPWTFAPVTDLGRDPRWSRMWENYGEDCYLTSEMGRESVLGFQGDDPNHIGDNHIAACMKHFMGYGVPVSGKDRTPASITEDVLREKHFAPYLEMVRNGALTVMINSGSNSGIPFHINHTVLTQWLKEDLNWDGMIVTDWLDIEKLWQNYHVAANKKEAIKMAINAGIDMSMDPYNTDFCDLLKELVEEGEVPMSRIDDAVRRVLRLKFRLNLFEKPYYDMEDYPLYGSEEHAAVALGAAEESLVLLKNEDDILPLAKGKRILVTGPNANSMRTLNGGWSYSWQGDRVDEFAGDYNTIYEALSAKFGARNVIYEPGVTYAKSLDWQEEDKPEIGRAVRAAAAADVIVACIGENTYCETPGNMEDLTLSPNQLDLVKALAKTGKPIVLIINEGRPRIISEIEPLAKAVVDIMLPGNYGGDALANLLAGDANFSGRMPFTYPKKINSLVNYDYKPTEHLVDLVDGVFNYDAVSDVQWAFGYGLSYTTFEYSNLRVDKPEFTASDELTFSVDVTNTGSVAGKESVLLFSTDLVASVSPDNRRLRAFEKVELAPGETKTVELKIKGSDLAFVGAENKWILEEGDFRIQVGDCTTNVTCTKTYKWKTPNR